MKIRLTMLIVLTVVLLLVPSVSQAKTVTGLSLSDGSVTDALTVVEWDYYPNNGTPGNTVRASNGGFWSTTTNSASDNNWWKRTNFYPTPNWVGLGGTNQSYNLKPPGERDEIVTTVSGLAAGTYDVYFITHANASKTWQYELGLNAPGDTALAFNSAIHPGLVEPGANGNGWQFWAMPMGTTSAATTTINAYVDAISGGSVYGIGVGYVLKSLTPGMVWNGTDNDYTSANWDAGVVPDSDKVMTVNGGLVTVSTDVGTAPGAAAALDIAGGSVTISATGILPTAAWADVAPGASLQVDGSLNTPTVNSGGTLQVNGTLDATTLNSSGTTTFADTAGGTIGQLNVTAGTTTFAGAAGATIGKLDVTGGTTALGGASVTGAINISNAGTVQLSAPLSTPALDISGAGVLTHNGNALTIESGGLLSLANLGTNLNMTGATLTAVGASVSITDEATLTVANELNVKNLIINGGTFNRGANNVVIAAGGKATFNGTNDHDFSGGVATGTLTLNDDVIMTIGGGQLGKGGDTPVATVPGVKVTVPGTEFTMTGNSVLHLSDAGILTANGAANPKITVGALKLSILGDIDSTKSTQGNINTPMVVTNPLVLTGNTAYAEHSTAGRLHGFLVNGVDQLTKPVDPWAVGLDLTDNARGGVKGRYAVVDLSQSPSVEIAGKILVSGVLRLAPDLANLTVSDTGVAGGEHGVVWASAHDFYPSYVATIETSGTIDVSKNVSMRGVKGKPAGTPDPVDLVYVGTQQNSGGFAAHGANVGDDLNLNYVFPGSFHLNNYDRGFSRGRDEGTQFGSETATGVTRVAIYDHADTTPDTEDLPLAVLNGNERWFITMFDNPSYDFDYVELGNVLGNVDSIEPAGTGSLVLTGHTGVAGSGLPTPFINNMWVWIGRDRGGQGHAHLIVDGTLLVNTGAFIAGYNDDGTIGGVGTVGGADGQPGYLQIGKKDKRGAIAPGSIRVAHLGGNTAGTLTVRGKLEIWKDVNSYDQVTYEYELAAGGNDLIDVQSNEFDGGGYPGDITFVGDATGKWVLALSDIDGYVASPTDEVVLMTYDGTVSGLVQPVFDTSGLVIGADPNNLAPGEWGIDNLTVGLNETDSNNKFMYLTGLFGGVAPIPPDLFGDLDDSDMIDDADLNLLLSSYDAAGPGGGPTYNQADLEKLLANFGMNPHPPLPLAAGDAGNSPQSVPEPGSLLLIVLGLLGIAPLVRRRKNLGFGIWDR